jgi:hypothetical protein
MPFIPKTILLDKGTPGHFEAYDILAPRHGAVTADSVVKQYIFLNQSHEFVQYLFSASDEEGYNIYGFVVKVPYDIDIEKLHELETPLFENNKTMDKSDIFDESPDYGGAKRRTRKTRRTKKN